MDLFTSFLLEFLISAVLYLAFPIIYRVVKGESIEKKSAIKIGIINSVICFFIAFIIKGIIFDLPDYNMVIGVTYYFISYFILTK